MTREIKYTRDGKKVEVVGKLNKTESIVKEVFVVNGKEQTLGENFVVSNLYEQPIISWKEKHLQEIEEKYKVCKERLEREADLIQESWRKTINTLRCNANYAKLVDKSFTNESLAMVVKFIEGDIKYIVEEPKNKAPKIYEYSEYSLLYNDRNLRLLSLFGQDDGSMTFHLHQYSDSSGYAETQIHPFSDKKSALKKFKEIIQESKISDDIIRVAKENGIKLDRTKIEDFKKTRIESLQQQKESYRNYTQKVDAEIKEVESI